MSTIVKRQNAAPVPTVDALKEHLKKGRNEFFIALGICRSSKAITLTPTNRFRVFNYIDETTEVFTPETLYSHSNIGEAMQKGSFFVSLA